MSSLSLRAQRGNPEEVRKSWIAAPLALLSMNTYRHCEQSEAIHDFRMHGLPRYARSDGDFVHGSCAVSGRYGWLAMTVLLGFNRNETVYESNPL